MAGFHPNSGPQFSRRADKNVELYPSYTWDISELFVGPRSSNIYQRLGRLVLLKDCKLPSVTFTKEKAKGASIEYNYAKEATYNDVKVVFWDTFGLFDLMSVWEQSVWSPETGLRTADVYKKDTIITKYLEDTDDSGTVKGAIDYKLVGSWPSSIDEGQLSYDDDSIRVVTMTITYDYCIKSKSTRS